MQRFRLALTVLLVFAALIPSRSLAQQATPVAQQATPVANFDFGVASVFSPLALFAALQEAPFPDDLLPTGVAPLDAFPWRDAMDPDLAGSIGAVIYADGDPFGAQPPAAITYMIFPERSGPLEPMSLVERYGEPAEIQFEGKTLLAGRADLGGIVGVFIVVDNVFLYGMAPTGEGADAAATALTEAGLAHLVQLASDVAPLATPIAGAASASEAAFLAMASAPFPADQLPFEVGPVVVLPVPLSEMESRSGLLGALVARDADRKYRYPIATYQFYGDEAAASAAVGGAGAGAETDLPPDFDIDVPATMLDRANDSTTILMQFGSTVVTVDAFDGNQEERHKTATTLAQIAIDHLVDVVGTSNAASGTPSAGAGDGPGSPVQLHEALLTATFPEALLPVGVGPLETSPWQDPEEPALAESLGEVTYSTGDLLSTQSVHTIAIAVYADSAAAEKSFTSSVAFVESLGDAPQTCPGIEAPSVAYEVAIMSVCLTQLDNVAISGMVLSLDDSPADEKAAQATSLAQAGITFLQQMADTAPR